MPGSGDSRRGPRSLEGRSLRDCPEPKPLCALQEHAPMTLPLKPDHPFVEIDERMT